MEEHPNDVNELSTDRLYVSIVADPYVSLTDEVIRVNPYDAGYIASSEVGDEREREFRKEYSTPLLACTRFGSTPTLASLKALVNFYKMEKERRGIEYFDPNYQNVLNGETAIMVAARNLGNGYIKNEFIKSLAEITDLKRVNNIKENSSHNLNRGNDVLMILLQMNFIHTETYNVILNKLVNTNTYNPETINADGQTAFMIACQKGNSPIINILLNLNRTKQIRIDIGKVDNMGNTALMYVCNLKDRSASARTTKVRILRTLLETRQSRPSIGGDAIRQCCIDNGLEREYEQGIRTDKEPAETEKAVSGWRHSSGQQMPLEIAKYARTFNEYQSNPVSANNDDTVRNTERLLGLGNFQENSSSNNHSDTGDIDETDEKQRKGGKSRKHKKSRKRRKTKRRKYRK